MCGFLLRELNLAARLLYFILVAYKIDPASSVVGLAFRNTRIPVASLTCSLQQIHPQRSQIGRKVTAGILQRETCVLFPADRETSCPSRADTTHFAHPASPKLKINRYALKTLHVSPAYTSPASRGSRHENLSLQNAVDFCRRFQPRLRQPLAPSPATHIPTGLLQLSMQTLQARAGTDAPGTGRACSGHPPAARLADAPFRVSAPRPVLSKVAFSSRATSLGLMGLKLVGP